MPKRLREKPTLLMSTTKAFPVITSTVAVLRAADLMRGANQIVQHFTGHDSYQPEWKERLCWLIDNGQITDQQAVEFCSKYVHLIERG